MQELKIQAKCVLDADGRLDQIKASLERGLEEFGPTKAHDKEVVVVGSGPSVKKQWKKIARLMEKGAMVLAIKGAHDFLIDKGVIPHAALAVDPLDHIWKCFRKKLPQGSVRRPVYLIASQCHESTFNFLEDQRIVLWHLLATSSHEFLSGKIQIGGGSTSGSRGVVLAYMMGFRKFHLFGFDSCLEGSGQSKLRKITGERFGADVDKEKVMELVCEGKTFFADPAMAAQANEIQDVFGMLTDAKFKAYGKGLIQTIVESNAEKGWDGYYAVSDEFGAKGIPAVRKKDAQHIKDVLRFAREGVYRGRDYFGDSGGGVSL
jgi:uncharacterized Rossmann fold enzyme